MFRDKEADIHLRCSAPVDRASRVICSLFVCLPLDVSVMDFLLNGSVAREYPEWLETGEENHGKELESLVLFD